MSSALVAGNKEEEGIILLLADDDDAFNPAPLSASPVVTSFEKVVMNSPTAFGDANGLSGRLCSKLLKSIIYCLNQNQTTEGNAIEKFTKVR